MGKNLLTYKNNTLWIHDWWISISAYFFLECIEEGNYDKALDPYKEQIIKRLQFDTNGFIAGALDLGTEIIIEADLIQPYVNSLKIVKDKVVNQGELITSEKCKEIENLNFDPLKGEKFNAIESISTKDLIDKLDEIINLFKDDLLK